MQGVEPSVKAGSGGAGRTLPTGRSGNARSVAVGAAILAIVAVAAGCTQEREGPTSAAMQQFEIVSGDGQRAAPGHVLPRRVTVRVVDEQGRPVVEAPVIWQAWKGKISPDSILTDDAGIASVTWRMPDSSGRDSAVAMTPGANSLGFTALAEEGASAGTEVALHALALETYDGSDQAVHPDHVRLPVDWQGATQALLATPYPFGNANFENPSYYTGYDEEEWTVPSGLTNPIVRPSGGYLSDPDALFDPGTGRVRVYYRQVTGDNRIWSISSADGIQWGAPELVVSAPNHQIISPTVVRRASNDWLMWAVNAGAQGCTSASTTVELRRSTDGEHWSAPEPVSLDQAGGFAWHIDVEWIAALNEYWAVYPLKTAGDCTTRALYFATSRDGVHWRSYPTPLLSRGAIPELMDVVYRSSIDYDAELDEVSIWYSGARYDGSAYVWRVAYERLRLASMLGRISTFAARLDLPAPKGPALTNETAP